MTATEKREFLAKSIALLVIGLGIAFAYAFNADVSYPLAFSLGMTPAWLHSMYSMRKRRLAKELNQQSGGQE